MRTRDPLADFHASDMSRCRFCDGESEAAFSARDRNQRVSDEPFFYRRCKHCSTVFLADVPPDLGRYYPPTYYPPLPSREELDRRARTHTWRLELVRRYVTSGRLVEIGASAGFFAHLAQRDGFEVTAIEMDARCCRHLREVVGVDVIESADPAAALARVEPVSAITAWHVLEHVDRPRELLEAAARALAPGGVLVVAAPNTGSLQFRLLGSRWPHVDAPRHLALIPLDALEARATARGLARVEATTADPAGEYDAFGWQGLLPSRPRGQVAHQLGRLVALLAAPVERRNGRGSAYTAVFRKRG